jgi:hypothetical protein
MTTYDEIPDRIWGRIEKQASGIGCWTWTGAISHGYGRVHFKGRGRQVHRVIYEALVGPVPEGLELDHLCRNRACANPRHLEAVTRHVNLLRGRGLTAKNAVKEACPQGHPYSPENTYIYKGGRQCLTCRRHVDASRDRTRPPLTVITVDCVICGTEMSFERRRGQSPNVCSEECRTERRRRAAKEHARRKRAKAA